MSPVKPQIYGLSPIKKILLATALILLPFLIFTLDRRTTRINHAAGLDPATIYLPIITRGFPEDTLFGIETGSVTISGGFGRIQESQSTWIRRGGIRWSELEPTEGTPLGNIDLSGLDQELANASSAGIKVILVVQSTPEWAQAIPSYPCGPVRPEKLPALANFLSQLVERYSSPPFNVKYWELWNEPDIDPALIADPENGFGCWGDNTDPFYGGGEYTDMLTWAYPAIKAADPDAQVLIGGLLLNCDPDLPGGCNGPHGSNPSKFLEGILDHHGLNDGKNFFDGISFHAYDYYLNIESQYNNPNWGTAWNTSGPVLIAKADYLRDILDTYGTPEKYLLNTESAILCQTCTDDAVFETTKARYLVQNYVAAIKLDLRANIWYSIFGWRNSGLIRPDLTTLPAYEAFVFARETLGRPTPLGDIRSSDVSDTTGITGARFLRGDQEIWVIWSQDGNAHPVTMALGTPAAIYDTFGVLQLLSPTVVVDLGPKYIIWP